LEGLVGVEQQRGGWERFGERTIYDSRWVQLGQLEVQAPSGQRFGYHVVRLPRIAIALIVNAADEVLMLWRYRVLTDQWGYELLGGLVEDGEHPAATAAREAREESGWAPLGQPHKLIEFEPLPGNMLAPVEVYLWRGCQHVGAPTDVDEAGRVQWIPLPHIHDLITRGQVLGAGSLIPLLYLLTSPPPSNNPGTR
jgi:8-oxo-dGTP pyrophosphatase MutT (NUDIX family)